MRETKRLHSTRSTFSIQLAWGLERALLHQVLQFFRHYAPDGLLKRGSNLWAVPTLNFVEQLVLHLTMVGCHFLILWASMICKTFPHWIFLGENYFCLGAWEDQLHYQVGSCYSFLGWLTRADGWMEQRGFDNYVVPVHTVLYWCAFCSYIWGRALAVDCFLQLGFSYCRLLVWFKSCILFLLYPRYTDTFYFLFGSSSKESASRALNFWMSTLYKNNVWISSNTVGPINAAAKHFLHAYSRLAFLSHRLKEVRFGINPKIHMFWHVWRWMSDQAAGAPWVQNPMSESCSSDEDFIGKFCFLTRCVNPRTRVLRSLQRYLTQVLLLWMHPKRKGWAGMKEHVGLLLVCGWCWAGFKVVICTIFWVNEEILKGLAK